MISQELKTKEVLNAAIGSHIGAADTRVIARPDWYQLITPSCKSSSLNEIIFSEILDGDVSSTIQRVIDEYQVHGVPFKWCVGSWTQPADLGSRLECLGFDHWSVRGMACEVDGLHIDAPSDVEVEALSTANLDDYAETFASGWGQEFPSDRMELLKAGLRRELYPGTRREFFLAKIEGSPVGTASFFLHPNSAYLTGGNVLAGFRGKGVYRALIRARLNRLKELSIPLATTHAREKTSAPILEKLGFETVFRYSIYELKSSEGQ